MSSNSSVLKGGTPDAYGDILEAPESIPKFWALKNTAEARIEWNKERYQKMLPATAHRAAIMFSNYLQYRGLKYNIDDGFDLRTSSEATEPNISRIVVPALYDYVDNVVNRLSRFHPTFRGVPGSGSHSDRAAAKATERLLKSIEASNRLPTTYGDAVRNSIIFSFYLQLILWDPYKSLPSRRWLEAKKAKLKKGEVKAGGDSFYFDPEDPERQGDVEFIAPPPWEVSIDPSAKRPEDVQWFSWDRWVHVDEVVWLAKKHPKASKSATKENIEKLVGAKLFGQGTPYTYDMDSFSVQKISNHVFVSEVWTRASRYSTQGQYTYSLPGLEIISDENAIPRFEDSQWGNLPLEWLTDLDTPYGLMPFSSFQILEPMSKILDYYYNTMSRYIRTVGSPKIFIPNQAGVRREVWDNDVQIIRYNHPYQPQTVTPSAIPGEMFAYGNLIDQKLIQTQGRQELSTGKTSPNIRSGRQIQQLEELESLRCGERNSKKNVFILNLMKKTKALIGVKYRGDDTRMVSILGKDKQFQIEAFNVSALNTTRDVELLPTTSLPQTPGARQQRVTEFLTIPGFKDLYSDEQWAAWLDLGEPEKFYDAASAAVDKAAWENEKFSDGKVPPAPIEGDDDPIHWNSIMTIIRSQHFLSFSEEIQEAMKDHAMAHEANIFKTLTSGAATPIFQNKVAKLSGFPAFYHEMMPPLATGAEQGPHQQASQKGPANGTPGADAGGNEETIQ